MRGHGSGTFLEELFGLEGKGAVVIAGTDVLCGSWRGGSGDRGAGLFWSGGIAERPARTFGGGEVLLMRHVAREWTVHGIRVNALCPDFFPAENNRRVLDESRVKATMDHTPTNRFGEAEELIGATLLLASEKAGSFITGSNLVVNGVFSVTSI